MTNEQKRQVKDALMRYVAKYDTQADAAAGLQGISAAVISQVKNENWELLSNKLWFHIARQVGFYCGEWYPADTSASLLLRILMGDAQHYTMTYGIAMGNGLGKTFTAAQYLREQQNVFYVSCSDEHNRKSFMHMLLKLASLNPSTPSIPDMLNHFTANIAAREEPLLIIDDAHKLKDRVLQLVVALVNALHGVVGVVIMGTNELRLRITEGIAEDRTGYERMYTALGRRFVTLSRLSPQDIDIICHANNMHDEASIAIVAEQCNNNLHNISALVQQHRPVNIAA